MPTQPNSAALAEVHVAGVLVLAPADRAPAIAALIAEMDGTEVHEVTPEGKLIVVCERATDRDVFNLIERIRDIPGVLDTALVYQHAESATAMEEEISDETDPPRIH